MMKLSRGPRSSNHMSLPKCLLLSCFITFTGLALLLLGLNSVSADLPAVPAQPRFEPGHALVNNSLVDMQHRRNPTNCSTVEEMGLEAVASGGAGGGDSRKESLRVRRLIRNHFAVHGSSRVRQLPPEQFCRQGFVMGKASEAGFGNEMYKILTAAGLSIMLNRSLIIGQTRGRFPFEEYVSYSNYSFTLKEVKHLWRQNDCVRKYGRRLVMRIDNFEKPAETNALCSNWRKWMQPIIWFQGTTDAVAAQFFLKNVHPQMRRAASAVFGNTESIHSRPNIIGELLRALISPSADVEEAVNWTLNGGPDPHLSVHMRMLMNRSVRATSAALNCIRTALMKISHVVGRPRVVLVSDTPSLIKDITLKLHEFAEVFHFDYKKFEGDTFGRKGFEERDIGFRAKDWGPAPRWVAFVDFFLASRAKHAVITGAQRRVGTTYAQLIAALAAAYQLEEGHSSSNFSFFSSFQSNLVSGGLQNQVGWGHVWNRYAGPLSCRSQRNQCALTPLLPPGWWDGIMQSPIPRDIRRMEAYGVKLSVLGNVDESHLQSYCKLRKDVIRTIPVTRTCSGLTCT